MSRPARWSRWIIAAEGLGTGCLGGLALLLGLVTLAGLPAALPATLSLAGIALGLLGVAALLAWLVRRLSDAIDRWTLLAAALQAALFPIGIVLVSIPAPQSDSPVDEGGHGLIASLGLVFVVGGVIFALLFAGRVAGSRSSRGGPRQPVQ